MGKLLILSKYIFLIFSSDILEDRKHIHVSFAHKGYKTTCKFWLEPVIEIDENKQGDFSKKELIEIEKLIIEHKEILLGQLELFFEMKPVKAIRL
ncbi:MAG: DUF4160 domain-containing protein [Bacteroidales bacterium]|nr:DUF4160 domain-containing protein [Bacteroidales bacterium]MCF8455042.1 DUF4160 domain-containing protein [Bacteroidales bacterium]